MFLTFMFALVLLLCFGLVLFLTRASKTEIAVRRSLATISAEHPKTPLLSTILKEERLSQIPWLDDLLGRVRLSWKLLDLVQQAGVAWQISSILSYSLLAALGGAVAASILTDGVVPTVVGATAAGLAPTGYLLLLRQRRLSACEALLPRAVELMARAMRAGLALNSALEVVGHDTPDPLGAEFRLVHEEQAVGLPLRDALMNLLYRIPRDDMRFLTTALLLQKETGGNLVQILDTVGFVMRERVRIRGQVKIYTAQARVSGWIVAGMPFIMYALLSLLNPQYERVLFNDPLGRNLFYVGVVLWVIGIVLVKKIVSIRIS